MNELLRRALFLPPQASTVARAVDHLHFFVILVTMAGAAGVSIVGGYFILRYRRRPDGDGDRHSLANGSAHRLEIIAVVGLLSLFVAWWWIGFRQFLRLRVAPEDSLPVYVTAKQWMWQFAYPEGAHSLATLYVPAGRPVELMMSSRDVIHSFYVPDFRIKQDVLPGRYTTVWFAADEPGTHDILCAEYCGANHSMMRGQVVVLSSDDYARWIAGEPRDPQKPLSPAAAAAVDVEPVIDGEVDPTEPISLKRQGLRIAAEKGCLRCHTLDGKPHIGPTWAGLYRRTVPLADGSHVVADEKYLTESMMDPRAQIHAGFANVMPSFQGRLTNVEVAALVELIRSLRALPRVEPQRETIQRAP